ncbi:unnamed protein product [Agarophyton chilense]
MGGQSASIGFYVVAGNGLFLLGNQLVHQCNHLGEQNLLVIPKDFEGLSKEQLRLQTYASRLKDDPEDVIGTRILVVPFSVSSISSFFFCYRSLRTSSTELSKRLADGGIAKKFASKLHGFTHMPLDDMKEICRRAHVLTPVLKQALKVALDKCTSCRTTGRPLAFRKLSFRRLLISFNHHVQVEYMFIKDMENIPILHMVDVWTAYSVTFLTGSREMTTAVSAFEKGWIDAHGVPEVVSGDPEFFN